jgi:hypothetical protein
MLLNFCAQNRGNIDRPLALDVQSDMYGQATQWASSVDGSRRINKYYHNKY